MSDATLTEEITFINSSQSPVVKLLDFFKQKTHICYHTGLRVGQPICFHSRVRHWKRAEALLFRRSQSGRFGFHISPNKQHS